MARSVRHLILLLLASLVASWLGSLAPPLFAALRPEYGGTVRVAAFEPIELDPARLPLASSGHLTDFVFETLFRLGPGDSLQGNLAERWEMGPDGLVLEVALLEALFSDGSPLTPATVLDSLARLRKGPQSWLIDSIDFEASGPVPPGWNQPSPKGDFSRLPAEPEIPFEASETEPVVDPSANRRLVLRLHQPDPALLLKLSHPATAITGPGTAGRLVGTGPFVIDTVSSDRSKVSLSTFSGHRAGRPYLDTVEFLPFPTLDAALRELERNRIDLTRIPTTQADRLSSGIPGLKLHELDRLETIALAVNSARFSDRHAAWIRSELDLSSMLRFRLRGHGELAKTFAPELTPYVNSVLLSPSPAEPAPAFSAMELLAPAHLPLARQLAERIRIELGSQEIQLSLRFVPPAEFVRRVSRSEYDLALVFVHSLGSAALTLIDWSRALRLELPPLGGDLSTWLVADETLRRSPFIQPLFTRRVHFGARSRLVHLDWAPGGRPTLEEAWWRPRFDSTP